MINDAKCFKCKTEAWHLVADELSVHMGKRVVLIVNDEINLHDHYDNALLFKKLDALPYENIEPNDDLEINRISCLYNIATTNKNVITSLDASMIKVISKEHLLTSQINISLETNISLSKLCTHLINLGYKNTNLVLDSGEFAVRGGIIDIFSPAHEFPARIDFFGDAVESIKYFSVESQRSDQALENFSIICAAEDANLVKTSFFDYFNNDTIFLYEYSAHKIFIEKIHKLKNAFIERYNFDNTMCDVKFNDAIIDTIPEEVYCVSEINYTTPFVELKYDEAVYTKKAVKRKKLKINSFVGIDLNDYVIHVSFGIGQYRGCIPIEVDNIKHDCIAVEYLHGNKLYVPVENLELVSKYADSDATVVLDQLGTNAWNLRKAKIKNRITEVADALIKLSAERALKTSDFSIVTDAFYDEFCRKFNYIETSDQLNAIDDVILDLKSGTLMDRLICGDVGFGKTEVALRAAYLVASAGKQVALVCPTTLLCKQHMDVFSDRFKNTHINIKCLSRFVSQKEARVVKEGIESGIVDIAIGTQALLSGSIDFKNLGLLIIDEEQHFGVKQKEILKNASPNTHVLTLSATPIPRTLQFALNGVKTMSLLGSPPIDRKTVQTFVLDYDAFTIREAIAREIERGGQVFYVTPRSEDLDELYARVMNLNLGVKIAVAHGKLAPKQLETTIYDFITKKYDVLISTNIIESGIDIPSANTIIINRSTMFGLSQLYQLRGRVGRANIPAYAYFTTESAEKITTIAQKRLKTIKSLDKFGASFSIATNDMDIRGAGNALGEAQSGNMREVGFELYQRMLQDAVNILKEGHSSSTDINVQLNLGVPIFIPHTYIDDLSLRLMIYKKISDADSHEELIDIYSELEDRFGSIPIELRNLIEVVKIKISCKQCMVKKVDVGPKNIVVSIQDGANVNIEVFQNFLIKYNCKRKDNKIIVPTICDVSNAITKVQKLIQVLKKFIFVS